VVLNTGKLMRRREFITLVGSATAAWPLAARAQQTTMPVIGYLNGASAAQFPNLLAGFRKGLIETGYSESRNVTLEYHYAEGQYIDCCHCRHSCCKNGDFDNSHRLRDRR
jgi:hypothetical protein